MPTKMYRVEYVTDAMSGIVFGMRVTASSEQAAIAHVMRTVPHATLVTVREH